MKRVSEQTARALSVTAECMGCVGSGSQPRPARRLNEPTS